MKFMMFAFVLLALKPMAVARGDLPVIRANSEMVTIDDGGVVKKDAWRLAPEVKPDIYEAELVDGKPHRVVFRTDVEEIGFLVEEGRSHDFIIRWQGKDCHTRIVGIRVVPAARFDERYQEERRGKILVDIPEVYELVNIAIAMTPEARVDSNLVKRDTAYFRAVEAWFGRFRGHKLIKALDAELRRDPGRYPRLKMDGNAFVFDGGGRIVQSPVFDRVSWGKKNELRPLLAELQSFADQTQFREFFRSQRGTYDAQIRFFQEEADIGGMKLWLDRNFPGASRYDSYNIIFSPLVGGSQSSNWFESSGFRELQPHVNYPYPEDFRDRKLSPQALAVVRGTIVFTEINHGYINPEGDRHAARIVKATSARGAWVDISVLPEKYRPGYYPGIDMFNEYMNWGLVSLRATDHVPPAEQQAVLAGVDRMMLRRGFIRFPAFNKFLVTLYRARAPGKTVADLYPEIIAWFETNNLVPPAR